jgi:hypothetical protein
MENNNNNNNNNNNKSSRRGKNDQGIRIIPNISPNPKNSWGSK